MSSYSFGISGLERNAKWLGLLLAVKHPKAEYLGFGLEPVDKDLPYFVEIEETPWDRWAKFDLIIEADRHSGQDQINILCNVFLFASREREGFTCQHLFYSDKLGSAYHQEPARDLYDERLHFGLRLRARLEMPFYGSVHWRTLAEEGLEPNTLREISHRGDVAEGLVDSPLSYQPNKKGANLFG